MGVHAVVIRMHAMEQFVCLLGFIRLVVNFYS